MLAHNNSDPCVCSLNLLRTIRGEVPLSRIKGIAREHIDAPATQTNDLRADGAWVLETYEPRLSTEEIDVAVDEAIEGNYQILADVS